MSPQQFPIDLSGYKPLSFSLSEDVLSDVKHEQLRRNIGLVRDTIIFFTALANAKGVGGHTGGAYDIVPEALIVDGFMRGNERAIYPAFFDEAGHRVALQYALAALNGNLTLDQLLHYREHGSGLWGHPERDDEHGILFSSGRLGHLWPMVNGIAIAHPDKTIMLFGSDGSQQEGTSGEAARLAVARRLNVKLLIDDNNVTISGHPHVYMPGFGVARTLEGHGLVTIQGDGEALDGLYDRIYRALHHSGPVAVVNHRKMAPDVKSIEGTPKGHDAIPVIVALEYLAQKGHTSAVDMLRLPRPATETLVYLGSTAQREKNREKFGEVVCDVLGRMDSAKLVETVRVFDNDLAGSCGLKIIETKYPAVYVEGGVMERGNFSAAAGFGFDKGRQGIYATFSAFLEMIISEITMAHLNKSNVLAHFSHAGVDEMADNTCHFGTNIFFADNGLPDGDTTRLYFPADAYQMRAVVERVFPDPGLRFIFSTRSAVPSILTEDGKLFFDSTNGYTFVPGKDEVIRKGSAGYIVSYGEMLYRCLDAVEKLRTDYNLEIGLINKPTLNTVDPETMELVGKAPFVLVAESQNFNTGLGVRFGTWLLEHNYHPRYGRMGVTRPGAGGLAEQIEHQGLGSDMIVQKVLQMAGE